MKVKEDMEINPRRSVRHQWGVRGGFEHNVASFIKEFVVRLPEGETLDFEAGGYIQVDVPETVVDYKDIAATRSLQDPNTFQSEWDKFGLWDLKDDNEEPIVRATRWPTTRQRATS